MIRGGGAALLTAVAIYILLLHTTTGIKTKIYCFLNILYLCLLLNSSKGWALFYPLCIFISVSAIFSKIYFKPHDTVTLIYSENTTEEELQPKKEEE